MSALQEVKDYLTDKIESVNEDNPKANTGAVYLKKGGYDISRLVDISLQIVQSHFTKSTSESEAGEARLTTVSSGIGNKIVDKEEERGIFTQWELEVRVGDLFIEAYYNTGFVDIYYPQTRNSFHIVTATNKWPLLEDIPDETIRHNLKGTVYAKPPHIEKMMQMHAHEEESLIKGCSEEDELDVDQPWVRAVDKLQRTGWRINNRVLAALPPAPTEEIKDNDAKELRRRSKLIEHTFITRKAQLLQNETFYQFIEADYRGRLYYAEPFLNFQGSDLARGLMKFSKGKPMDQYGLFWLAVHTACSYNQSYNIDEIPDWCEADYLSYLQDEGLDSISVDKMTLEDRVRWTNHSMEWIREAGQESIRYDDAEKPISFLACCFEWCDYHIALESNTIYRTHLPIPIDGSNNGWQHLGAISKDPKTGILVGLIPSEIQKDFYVQTAKELYTLTEEGRLKDLLDSMPMKHIRKGISKRGSMTRAYSAGAAKIGENMWFDCKTEDFHEKYGITEEDCMALAKILVKAITNVCPGPLKTMSYLQAIAGAAISQGKEMLEWTTPSGFPVKYTCFYNKKCSTKGTIAGYTKYNKRGAVNHIAQVYTDFPDMRGFMCGISPNFIHSMDAAHMALVIDQWNGDFGAVHDSFSTHSSDVELLLAHTKREFIEMYDVENYFEIIEDTFIEVEPDVPIRQPQLGTLNIEEIEDSDYFFA